MIQNIIKISAAIIIDENEQLLLVRKQNSPFFMQAGGKIESDETPSETLIRELKEELDLTVESNKFEYLGQFSASAANEKDHIVVAHLFTLNISNRELTANAELQEVDWFTLQEAKQLRLAPLTGEIILPIVEELLQKPAN